jgi:hypothetical protein
MGGRQSDGIFRTAVRDGIFAKVPLATVLQSVEAIGS